ncbi:xylose isomerase, partial [Sinorhizobium meliloti]
MEQTFRCRRISAPFPEETSDMTALPFALNHMAAP